jgi:tRNA (guanine26-N2/guanine27-N2)-dimethyltransferase
LRDPRPVRACPACGSKTLLAGPLWLGSIHEKGLIGRALAESGKGSAEARRLLEACGAEEDLPMYYDHHRICRRLGVTPVKADQVVRSLRNSGWKASRTHFSGVGIKTDAGIRELEGVLRAVG